MYILYLFIKHEIQGYIKIFLQNCSVVNNNILILFSKHKIFKL